MQEGSKQFKTALLLNNRRAHDYDFGGKTNLQSFDDQQFYTESSGEIGEGTAADEEDFYALMMRQIGTDSEEDDNNDCECHEAKVKKQGRKRLKLVQPMRDSLDQFFNLDHRLHSRGDLRQATSMHFSGSL